MKFEEAYNAAKRGEKVRRELWGKGVFYYLVGNSLYVHNNMDKNDKTISASETDRAATDWEIIRSQEGRDFQQVASGKQKVKLTEERIKICLDCLFVARDIGCADENCLVNQKIATEKKKTLSDKMNVEQMGVISYYEEEVKESIKRYRIRLINTGMVVGKDVAKEEQIANEEFGKRLV